MKKTTVTYDTITIKTQNYNRDKISALIDTCDDAAIKHRKDGSWLKTGSHNHVRLFVTEASLAINFNPNKMMHGTNEINTTIDTYIQAMVYLESWLNLHLHDATVSRVDAGINIFTVKEPSKYIELLAHCSKAMKVTYAKETLTFTNGVKDTVFYDKGRQMDKMKLPRLASHQSGNLLRIEIRCKKPKLALNVPQLTAGMLMEDDIINKIVQLWQKSYLNIHKVVRPQADVDCSDTKNFVMSLANHGVEALGIDAVLNHIDSVSDQLSVVQRHRLRKKLFKITSSHTEGSTQILLDELSEKIQWIAANAI
jgi:hypothetical protein